MYVSRNLRNIYFVYFVPSYLHAWYSVNFKHIAVSFFQSAVSFLSLFVTVDSLTSVIHPVDFFETRNVRGQVDKFVRYYGISRDRWNKNRRRSMSQSMVPVIKCGSIDTRRSGLTWDWLRGDPRCPFNPSPKRRNTTLQKMKTGAGCLTHICAGIAWERKG